MAFLKGGFATIRDDYNDTCSSGLGWLGDENICELTKFVIMMQRLSQKGHLASIGTSDFNSVFQTGPDLSRRPYDMSSKIQSDIVILVDPLPAFFLTKHKKT
jgi:hypothetical protein